MTNSMVINPYMKCKDTKYLELNHKMKYSKNYISYYTNNEWMF